MKTLAVIKNELFQDYLRFVSTSDLPNVLDNPDIPVPFTCVESVDNNNADELLEQIKFYFNNSKIKNKDFFIFNEDSAAQLKFMFNLIKLSSGQQSAPSQTSQAVVETVQSVTKVSPVVVIEPVLVPHLIEEVISTPIIENHAEPALEIVTPNVVEANVQVTPIEVTDIVDEVFSVEEDDPFGFKVPEEIQVHNPVVSKLEPVPVLAVEEVVTVKVEAEREEEENVPLVSPVLVAPVVEMIASLGIPKGSIIHFIKDESITAILVDEKTVHYNDQNMTLVEAAKAAFKRSSTVGMAVGLSNWNFSGETLKSWKEKQLN